MSGDIDFDQLIDLLDRALVSDDPKVKKALKKFLFIAALATEETEEEGPFRNILRRIEALEHQAIKTHPIGTGGTGWPPTTGSPIWYNTGTGTTTTATWKKMLDDNSAGYFGDNTSDWYTVNSTCEPVASSTTDSLIESTMADLEELQKQAADLQKD